MKRPTEIKDKKALEYISYLESELKRYTSSPYLNSYLSIKSLLDRGNEQIKSVTKKSINFEDESFKNISKFISSQRDYTDQMEYFKSKMNPEEAREAEKLAEKNNLGIAEKIALGASK